MMSVEVGRVCEYILVVEGDSVYENVRCQLS